MTDATDLLSMNPVEALLAQTSLKRTLFSANSRYYGVDTATLAKPQGKSIVYLLRRFLPPSDNFQVVQEHVVAQGERLANIAAQFLGDPELFWRLCDANDAMRPDELTETIGRRLRITLPQGITGTAL